MRSWRKFLISAGVVVVLSGGVIAASASTTKQATSLFSACLNSASGTLSKVTVDGTPSCSAHSRLVTWDAQGAKGPAGTPGTAGARGSLWTTGTGAPTLNSSQQTGDLFLDTTTGNVYELVTGSWTLEGNVEGPRGFAGAAGAAGDPGSAGARGSLWTTGSVAPALNSSQQAGDLYLDTATGDVYELVTGSWTLEENIEGPAGTASYSCSATAFPGIDYAGCDLSNTQYNDKNLLGANLTGADLASSFFNGGSNFDGADFSGATMTGSHLYNSASFVNADFTGANLTGAYLYTAGTDFTNANFTGANLSGAYLYNGADFTNANFTGANLTGALLSEATLSSAVWNNTTCPNGTNSSSVSPQTCVASS